MATKPNQTDATDATEQAKAAEEAAEAEAEAKAAEEAAKAAAASAPASATVDEFGRLRVRDRDTGHERTIQAAELPHGRYTVLNQRATDRSGDPLPPKHASS